MDVKATGDRVDNLLADDAVDAVREAFYNIVPKKECLE